MRSTELLQVTSLHESPQIAAARWHVDVLLDPLGPLMKMNGGIDMAASAIPFAAIRSLIAFGWMPGNISSKHSHAAASAIRSAGARYFGRAHATAAERLDRPPR